ncbi:MAG: heme o synthase [Nitrososphaeria archaeon]|nr:heme o synthase [Conexivisphaerales archaeon]
MSKLGAYVNLTKPAVSLLLFLGGITGAFMDFEKIVSDPIEFLIGMIALYLAIAGANALSNYIDRDIDAKMKRTCNRALPSGKLTPKEAITFATSILIIGLIIALFVNLYEFIWILAGIIFDPILYNFMSKRRTYYNILIGSIAGGTPVMAGWSAVTGELFSIKPFLILLAIIIWTPVHIWSIAIKYKDDYQRANIPMLPVVKGIKLSSYAIGIFAIALFLVTAFYGLEYMNMLFALIMIMFGIVILALSIKLFISSKVEKDSMRLFIFSNIYLAIVFILIIVYSVLNYL